MKTQLLKLTLSQNGGTNNIHIVRVINERLQGLKTFTSKKSMEAAEKRAVKFQEKL